MNQQQFKKWQVKEGLTMYNARTQQLSTTDILAHIIRDRDLAIYILDTVDFDELKNITIPEITSILNSKRSHHLSNEKMDLIAEQIVSAIELGRRVNVAYRFDNTISLGNPATIREYVIDKFTDMTGHEELIVIFLNTKLQPIRTDIMFRGTIRATVFSAREILINALKYNAESIIMCHNHPGGTLEPNSEDRKVTIELRKACSYLDIRFIDHVIITEEGYYSIADEEGIQ